MSAPINTCVLGYGLSAKVFQIPYIQLTPGLVLHSILQRTPTAANDAAADHPTAKIHSSLEAVLADPEIQLVIVSTANSTHYPMAKALLEAGKHVVVEKPFTVTAAEADDLVEVGKRAGRILTAFQSTLPCPPPRAPANRRRPPLGLGLPHAAAPHQGGHLWHAGDARLAL